MKRNGNEGELMNENDYQTTENSFEEESPFGFGFERNGPNMSTEDIFAHLFGMGKNKSGRRSPSRGRDIQQKIRISFMEAVNGCKKEISVSRVGDCSSCNGSGAKKGTKPAKCKSCGGRGMVEHFNKLLICL